MLKNVHLWQVHICSASTFIFLKDVKTFSSILKSSVELTSFLGILFHLCLHHFCTCLLNYVKSARWLLARCISQSVNHSCDSLGSLPFFNSVLELYLLLQYFSNSSEYTGQYVGSMYLPYISCGTITSPLSFTYTPKIMQIFLSKYFHCWLDHVQHHGLMGPLSYVG